MNRGAVFFYSELTFHDGGKGEKLLIVINSPKKGQNYLCCKTTSKPKNNKTNPGCYSNDSLFVVDPIQGCFRIKTWIQFHEIYEFRSIDFLKLHFKDQTLNKKADLPQRIFDSLIECIKRSPDVSKAHLSML